MALPLHERQIDPIDTGGAIFFLTGCGARIQNRMQVFALRQRGRLLCADLEHPPSRRNRPVPDFHDERAARPQQRGKVRHGLPALLFVEMHPDGGQHHEVEGFAAGSQSCEIRQAVVEPVDPRRGMQRHGRQAHRIGRLDGNDGMPAAGKPRRIAPGARTDVEHTARHRRNQMQHGPVRVGEGNAFILPEKRLGLFGIAFRSADLRHMRLRTLPIFARATRRSNLGCRHSGAMRSIEPGISRFRVWC